MKVRVLFFSTAREISGCAECTLTGAEAAWSQDVFWERLLEQFSGLAALRSSLRLAKNREYLSAEASIGDGDEMALIPPVSGG